MQDTREALPLRPEYRKRIAVRLAVVDADGQSRLPRQMQLRCKEFALDEPSIGVFLPIVVEPDLPDGDDLWVPRPGEELRTHLPRERHGVLGVNADGGVECRIGLSIRHDACGRRHRVAHADDARNARLLRACDHRG